ncbi:MAG: hypothetical protein AAGF74_11345 [Pseudomonadota bacterium]
MTRLIPLSFALLAVACTPVTENTGGDVARTGDGNIIVIGPKEHGRAAEPTRRMVEQARAACPGATFHSARPSMGGSDDFDFLFIC